MAIEALIEKLIASLDANTAALAGGAKTSTKTGSKAEDAEEGTKSGTKGSTGKKGAAKSKYDAEQVKAVAIKLRDATDQDTAKALIKKHGASQLADLKPEAYDAFVAEAEKLIEGDGGEEGDDGDL